MPRMIDLIRASAVPSNLMQSAARAALSAPNTSKEVLQYFIASENLRPALLPALLENPSLAEATLAEAAGSASREVVEAMLKSGRINHSEKILSSLSSNPNLTGVETTNIKNKLASGIAAPVNSQAEEERVDEDDVMPEMPADEPAGPEDVLDEALMAYFAEHEKEITANQDKPFQPIGSFHENVGSGSEEPLAADPEAPIAAAPTGAPAPAAPAAATTAAAAGVKKAAVVKKGHDEGRGSALQKI